MDSITAARFRPWGIVLFDEATTLLGSSLSLGPMGGATLFLLLHDIWYLYPPENCENGLNRRPGKQPSSTNVFKEQAFLEIESRIYYLSRHRFPCVPTVIIFMFSLPTQVCNCISDWVSMWVGHVKGF